MLKVNVQLFTLVKSWLRRWRLLFHRCLTWHLIWEIWPAFRSENDVPVLVRIKTSRGMRSRGRCWDAENTFHMQKARPDRWMNVFRGPPDSEALADSGAMAAMTACVIPPVTPFIYEIRCNMVTGLTSCHACALRQKQELPVPLCLSSPSSNSVLSKCGKRHSVKPCILGPWFTKWSIK